MHTDIRCLEALAEALHIPDGQRGVTFYLLEAAWMIDRPSPWPAAALDALSNAIRQDDCQAYHKPLIARARRAVRRMV